MAKYRFALVDCNNFYASCERVFEPKLERKAIVVLSNNDGCVIARSNEAKILGIKMGVPYFKVKEIIKRHSVVVKSSNYPLYGDMSSRVMNIISKYSPSQEIYSIDESFLEFSGMNIDLVSHMYKLKKQIKDWTGIPVCVGIGDTKVLAKLANRIAKKYSTFDGVFDIDSISNDRYISLLSSLDIVDIWGIGRQSAKKLKNINIHSGYDLYKSDISVIESLLGVNGKRIYQELKGHSCIGIESIPPTRKQIVSSRSFGSDLSALAELKQALTSLTRVAIKKLKSNSLATTSVSVFVYTNPHKKNTPFIHLYRNVGISIATDDESLLIPMVAKIVDAIYKPKHNFYKGGVVFGSLVKDYRQQDLYSTDKSHQSKANSQTKSELLQSINSRFNDSVKYASELGNDRWLPRAEFKSNRYTTEWSELLNI